MWPSVGREDRFLSVITRFAVGLLGCMGGMGGFYVVDMVTCRVDDMNAVFNIY